MAGSDRQLPVWAGEHLEVKDWVVVKPCASKQTQPLGTWVGGSNGLWVAPESALLKVPRESMGLDYLAHHQALATAYRLLEDFGTLRLGDCIIQNAAESPVGVAVIQLCRMLRLSCINVLEDTDRFDEAAERLRKQWGATVVLRDREQLSTEIEEQILPKWSGIFRPRLALDGVVRTQPMAPPESACEYCFADQSDRPTSLAGSRLGRAVGAVPDRGEPPCDL
jgi:NADPH:quinone reductase-like Zn-dependent oxidoreductase